MDSADSDRSSLAGSRPDSPLTPDLITKIGAECDRVAERWAPVAECLSEANAALARVKPPASPADDPTGLYYPLLFLVRRIEEYERDV